MSDESTVLVYGGINIDLVTRSDVFPMPGQTILGNQFITYPGGKGANQAVSISRLGLQVSLLGGVGDDVFGSALIQGLAEKGVEVDGISVMPGIHSGVAVINIDGTSQNQIIQVHGANAESTESVIIDQINTKHRVKYLLLQLETPVEVSAVLANKAKQRDITVILDPGPTRPIPPDLWSCVDFITPNETEAEYLTDIKVNDVKSGFAAARKIYEMGIPSVIVKMGSQGALYLDHNQEFYVPAVEVDAIDSVAAGDAFNGAFTYGLYNSWSVEDSVKWAVCSGGLATTKTGAQDSMPALKDVQELYKKAFQKE